VGLRWPQPLRHPGAGVVRLHQVIAPCGDLLLLRARPRLRARVHQDLHLLPVPGQGVGQRPRVGQAPGRPRRDRLHRPGQRIRVVCRPRRVGGHLRAVRADRRAGVLRPLDRPDPHPVHRRGPRRRLLVGAVDAPSRGQPHPGSRRSPPGPALLRGVGGRQHRHRPPAGGPRRVRSRPAGPHHLQPVHDPASSGRAPR